MRVDLFDYELPPELIAQRPVEPRDSSRLFVVHRQSGRFEHRRFRDLPEYLQPGDCLVLNNTKVIPARVYGTRVATGGRWEGLFLERRDDLWRMMTKTRGKPQPGETIRIHATDNELTLELIERVDKGVWMVRPSDSRDPFEVLAEVGHVPLPPYIRAGKDAPEDRQSYQTVFARTPGAVAAPTAGLHFTPELLEQIAAGGVQKAEVTLHVGPGTFQPVSVQDARDHVMHREWCEIEAETADRLNQVKQAGGRRIAVGTTSVRVLESAAMDGRLTAFRNDTRLFILPPYPFKATDALVTNFHLPKSTLLMLVCAFGGTELVLDAYREAVKRKYRFYSYGDAMALV